MTNNPNLDLETKVIDRFVIKTKGERFTTFIKNDKNRDKFTKALAHFNDLRKDLFEEVKGNEYQFIKDRIKSLGHLKDCYIISENSDLDAKRFDIETALRDTIGQGMGTLIIFGDAEVIYYEGEGPSDRWISKTLS
jgi:predicted patatin/cPLA2 family phospholipase